MKCASGEHRYKPYAQSRALYCRRCGDRIDSQHGFGAGRSRRRRSEPPEASPEVPPYSSDINTAEADQVRQMRMELDGNPDLEQFADEIMERRVPVEDDGDEDLPMAGL